MTERHWQMQIGGAERDASSGRTLDVVDPSTGAVIADVPDADAVDIDAAIAVASAAGAGEWSSFDRYERARTMFRFATVIRDNLDRLFRLESSNNGRPVIETRAQLSRLPDFYEYFAGLALADRGDVVPTGPDHLTYVRRHPLGVCAVVTPFNHPMLILARPLAALLAAGNTAVVKPSEHTPLTTLVLAQLAHEAGIPDGVINVVTGGPAAGSALVSHPDIAKVSFTGGVEAGRRVAIAGADNFTKVTTELGGKSPILVFDDADLDATVAGVAFAAFIAAGQTCIAGTKLLVQSSIYEEFCERLVARARDIRIGNPSLETTQLGPLISARQRDRVITYVARGVADGATVACGGAVPDLPQPLSSGFFFEPTLLTNVDIDMAIAQDEIFGPVTVAIAFDDEDDAVRLANASRFGLGAGVWTDDVARAHRVAGRLQAGMTWINDHHRLDPALPWGGMKQSGVGKEGGIEAFHDYSSLRAVIVRTAASKADWYASDHPARLN